MAIFPTDINIATMEEETIRPVIKTSYQGGYEQTRARFTRKIKKFSLTFNFLTKAQKDEMETFIMDNQGISFTFVDPRDAVNYQVRHEADSIKFQFRHPFYYSTQISIKEV